MPSLNSFSLIDRKIQRVKIENSLNQDGLAFVRFTLENIFNLTDDEIEESITDSSNDGGIDAIYIQDNEANIISCKYTNKFENTNKNFPETDINNFTLTVSKILSGTLTEGLVNDAIWDKYIEIRNILSDKAPINFKLFVISNLLKPSELAKRKYEETLEIFRFVEFYYYDLEDLTSKIIENKVEKIDGALTFIDKQYFEKSDGPIRTLIGAVDVLAIISILQDSKDSEKINEKIFDENIRIYKPKHRINKSIIETALQLDNYQFFYLNNGITIFCENFDYMPGQRTPRVEMKNFQIINGGQTSHSIFEAYKINSEIVKNIIILVRICEAKKGSPIADKIRETTNSQIPVQTRDLRANDYIQRKLEDEFLELGYFYERKKNQHQDKPKLKRLDNELLGQLYLSYYFDMPSEARNSKAIVFGNNYELIFDEDKITAQKMLLPYKIYIPLLKEKKEIQFKKRQKEKIDERGAFISRGAFHIVNAVKFISEKKNYDLTNQSILDNTLEIAKNLISDLVIKEMNEKKESYSHDKFFKEIPTDKIIREHILRNI